MHNAVLLFMLLSAAVAPAVSAREAETPRYAGGHVIVKLKEEEVLKVVPDYRKKGSTSIPGRLGMPAGARIRETDFGRWIRKNRGEPEEGSEDLSVFLYLDLPPGFAEQAALKRLKGHPMVEYAELDPIGSAGATYPTNDPLYVYQWQYNSTNSGRIWMPEAWDITQGTNAVVVAVLDTGCNTNLQDFAGRTVPGWDFVNSDSQPNDDNNHGTAVSALLCATANDGYRMAGVDWRCRLMPLKVLDSNAVGQLSWWAQATYYAVSNGARVINLSAGAWTNSAALSNAVCYAVSNGVTFVTITHNDGMASIRFPASMNETIAVGGIDMTGRLWSASNHGTNTDLVAPSTNLMVLLAGGGWMLDAAGTSFAAPMVSGAAGLLLSIDPALNNDRIRDLLCAGAQDRVSSDLNDTPGYDSYYGWGKLNVYNSLQLLLSEIDTVKKTNANNTYLSWPCPKTAVSNQPFGVQWTDSLAAPVWYSATNINYTYSTGRAYWTGSNGTASSRYFRTYIKQYKSW